MLRNQYWIQSWLWNSRNISEFPRYDIEPTNRESEKNTETLQGDSEPTISFDQDTKQINWYTSLFYTSNSSSTTSVSGFATSANSGYAFEILPGGENHSFRRGKGGTELVNM